MKTTKYGAIDYTRYATYLQVADSAEDIQFNAIKAYCETNNIALFETFTDIGSGFSFERKSWKDMELFLENHKSQIQFLVVSSMDRIGREKTITVALIAYLELKYKISVISLIDSSLSKPMEAIL